MSTEICNQNDNNTKNIPQEMTPQRMDDNQVNENNKGAFTKDIFF